MKARSIFLALTICGVLAVGLPTHASGAAFHPLPAQDEGRPGLNGQWFSFGDDKGVMLTTIDGQGRSLMFICEGGADELIFTHDVLTPEQTSVTLLAGEHSTTYDILPEGTASDPGERQFMLATLSLDDAVIRSFRETDRLVVAAAGLTLPTAVSAEAKPTVERFFTACAAL